MHSLNSIFLMFDYSNGTCLPADIRHIGRIIGPQRRLSNAEEHRDDSVGRRFQLLSRCRFLKPGRC